MRKLASIQTINAIEPIPKADAIEMIRVLGWKVIVKKGEFAVGDRVVYCEIDSLLPERPKFEFLRASSFKPAQVDATGATLLPAGFRIKTVKLRGQVSQGICFPMSILPEGAPTAIDSDVTTTLGIHKWEAPIPATMAGKVKGGFPAFLPKTDETRVQVLGDVLERHRGKLFGITEKLDGTSFTAFVRNDEFGICSRNLWLDETDERSILGTLAKSRYLKDKLLHMSGKLGFDLAIQAEVIGPGIQNNKYKLNTVELRVFNLFDVSAHRYVDEDTMRAIVAEMGLQTVPFLEKIMLNHSIDELVAFAEGMSTLNKNVQREGIVLRPTVEEDDPDLGRLSFKAINPKFLLKYDE